MDEEKPLRPEVLIAYYTEHASWARYFEQESTKVNSYCLTVVLAIIAFGFGKDAAGNDIEILLSVAIILLGILAFLTSRKCIEKSEETWKIAVKARKDLYEEFRFQEYVQSAQRHVDRLRFEEKFISDKMIYYYWYIIDGMIVGIGVWLLMRCMQP